MRLSITILAAMTAGLLSMTCGGGSEPDLLDELGRVAPVEQGFPTLVFVYTDG